MSVLTSPNNGFMINKCDSTPSSENGLPDASSLEENQVLVCRNIRGLSGCICRLFEEVSVNTQGSVL